ncbi:type II/IV secretion system protein [Clostridium sp. NSJ-49]|uniref:General secretion pathway protein n=2 Tax=Clostridiaceae TaxID=31979 RepID=A0A174GE30_9CLOT|nr:type II/IV secretion system protein [Clostridium sp. NSJ-49]CUO58675.1 general secretion pathway protein [Clostridium disporicum]
MLIDFEKINIKILRKITKDDAKRLKAIPYRNEGEKIYIIASNVNLNIKNELKFIFDKELEIKEIDENTLFGMIERLYVGLEDDVEEIIIRKSIELNASDIHFEPREKFTVVRMRIDGKLVITNILTLEEHLKIISKLKVKSNLDITEKRRPQDGKLTFKEMDKNYDLRLSFTNTIFGEKLVVRILYGQVFNYKLESLRLTKNQMKKIKEIIKVSNGLVLVNGPTGSGKSTTLYTILQEVNTEEVNITTLEDPVEVVMQGINQIALNKTIDLNFAEALRSTLRQDPDIIMVGEIRDDETAVISATAAITGHKVYSTIHTKTAREVFFRLEDMGVKNYIIKDSLVGIISQRLIRILCDDCKVLEGEIESEGKKINVYKKRGCSRCNFTGYRGRALVAAIHHMNKENKRKLVNLNEDDRLLSNKEMVDNLKELLKDGLISCNDYNLFLEVEEIEFDNEDKYTPKHKT